MYSCSGAFKMKINGFLKKSFFSLENHANFHQTVAFRIYYDYLKYVNSKKRFLLMNLTVFL